MPQPYEPHFSELLNLFARLIDRVHGQPLVSAGVWRYDAQTLAIKLFRHSCSLKQLSKATEFSCEVGTAIFVDHASVKAITRVALETYLVFVYIYGSGQDDICAYRHLTWKLGGLIDRNKLTATTDDHRSQLLRETTQADGLRAELIKHPLYQVESTKRREELMKGNWRFKCSWQQLGEAAGFHPTYFRDAYSFLCGYAHSSWASALQISQAKTLQEQTDMATGIMGFATGIVARFIEAYRAALPEAKSFVFTADEKEALSFWIHDRAEMERHYKDAQ